MLRDKWHLYVLTILFLSVLTFRLFFSLSIPGFTGDNAYATLRQVDHISEHYGIMLYDDLSYGGRELLVSPLFYYFLTFSRFFISETFVFKILPEVLLSLLVVVVYFITYELTKEKGSALIAALLSGFVPLVIGATLNSLSSYSLFFLIFLMLFFFLIKINQGELAYVDWFVFLSFLLPLIHPGALIFVLALIFYWILILAESSSLKPVTTELVLFSIFLVSLVEFVIFKEAFLEHGLSLIRYNLPSRIIEDYFVEFSALSLLYSLGIVSVILGCIGIYIALFKTKSYNIFLFIGLILSVLLLLLLKLVDFSIGILFLSISFPILAGFSLRYIYRYLSNLRFSRTILYFNVLLVFSILLFSVLPSYTTAKSVIHYGVSEEEIRALSVLKDLPQGIVLADLEEGNMVNYYADKKTLLDRNFLLISNANFVVRDAKLIFLGSSDLLTSQRIANNEITYVYFSFRTKERYNSTTFLYSENTQCVETLHNETYQIFRVIC